MMASKSPPIPQSAWRDPLCVVALGFGAGALPKAPGTWGTLAALPFYLLMARLPFLEYVAVTLALFVVGIWICDKAGRVLGEHDHGAIVWDEMVGFWVAMAAAPSGWLWIVAGFVLFRLFDIWKPWPIFLLDQRVSGGLGVMVDDMVAGIYAAICLYLCVTLFIP
jgi:phosphatidylglycerophosphatase A